MRLKIMPKASEDLTRISTHIAQHDIEAAVRVVVDLEQRMRLLVTVPNMGRATKRNNVRELILDDYTIPYRVRNDLIEVLRVWHSKQRWWD